MYLTEEEIADIINDEIYWGGAVNGPRIEGIPEAARRIAEVMDEVEPEVKEEGQEGYDDRPIIPDEELGKVSDNAT